MNKFSQQYKGRREYLYKVNQLLKYQNLDIEIDVNEYFNTLANF